ncbi:hypothetical protein KAI56_02315 [Candidatus Parcubacteria bacterium]|nr:hypothetical protein [Candidatus Parcubacteria bacterium]
MEKFEPEQENTQRPDDFQKIVDRFKERGLDSLAKIELLEMTEGGNPKGTNDDPEYKGIRSEFYPEWEDDDFKALLEELGWPIQENSKDNIDETDSIFDEFGELKYPMGSEGYRKMMESRVAGMTGEESREYEELLEKIGKSKE